MEDILSSDCTLAAEDDSERNHTKTEGGVAEKGVGQDSQAERDQVAVAKKEPLLPAKKEPLLPAKKEPLLPAKKELLLPAKKEPSPPTAKKEPSPVAAKKELSPTVVKKEPSPTVVKKEPLLPLVKKEPSLPAAKKEAPPPVAKEDPSPPAAKKELLPAAAKKEPSPKKEPLPPAVKKEASLPVAKKEPSLPAARKEPSPPAEVNNTSLSLVKPALSLPAQDAVNAERPAQSGSDFVVVQKDSTDQKKETTPAPARIASETDVKLLKTSDPQKCPEQEHLATVSVILAPTQGEERSKEAAHKPPMNTQSSVSGQLVAAPNTDVEMVDLQEPNASGQVIAQQAESPRGAVASTAQVLPISSHAQASPTNVKESTESIPSEKNEALASLPKLLDVPDMGEEASAVLKHVLELKMDAFQPLSPGEAVPSNGSSISVSSVHTSDLSSFDDAITMSSSSTDKSDGNYGPAQSTTPSRVSPKRRVSSTEKPRAPRPPRKDRRSRSTEKPARTPRKERKQEQAAPVVTRSQRTVKPKQRYSPSDSMFTSASRSEPAVETPSARKSRQNSGDSAEAPSAKRRRRAGTTDSDTREHDSASLAARRSRRTASTDKAAAAAETTPSRVSTRRSSARLAATDKR